MTVALTSTKDTADERADSRYPARLDRELPARSVEVRRERIDAATSWGLRVFKFFGEALRQAGILIVSSTLVIFWALVFIIGLECGVEGGVLHLRGRARRPTRACSPPGVTCASWCRYVFGYMMAAKVGTGIVAELGSMRISDEIDALEVMGIDSVMRFLCATRLLAAMAGTAVRLPVLRSAQASSPPTWRSCRSSGTVSSGGFLLIFWQFQNPTGRLIQPDKGDVRWPLRHRASWAATTATTPVVAPSVWAQPRPSRWCVNLVSVHLIGMLGTQLFWGANPRAPIGG